MRNFLSDFKFTIYKNFTLSSEDEEVITLLYLPIIQKDAYSLYFYFYNLIKLQNNSYFFYSKDMFNNIGYSSSELVSAIRFLEGVHLLQTFERETIDSSNTVNTEFLFKLISPASAEKFFKDNMLKSLLYSKINNEKQYERLKSTFKIKLLKEDKNFKNVSCSFNDVYSIPTFLNDKIDSDDFNNKKYISEDHFDEASFLNRLKENNISFEILKDNYEDIKNLAILYGVDADELIKIINQSTSLEDNKFYFNKFKNYISKIKKFVSISPDKKEKNNVSYDDNLINAVTYFSKFNSVEEFLVDRLNNKPDKNIQEMIQYLKLQYKFSNIAIMIILDYCLKKTDRFNEKYIYKVCQSVQLKADINDPLSIMSTILNNSNSDKKALSKKEKKTKDVVEEKVVVLNDDKTDEGDEDILA